jgi:imidazolonepropionase-like amidohydrolase
MKKPTTFPSFAASAALGGVVAALATVAPSTAKAPPSVVAFVHAAVVPMDEERVLQDQTVVVKDGEIVAIGPSASVRAPARAKRINARGRYLTPALSDMHVHLLGESWNAAIPPEQQLERKDVPFESFLFPYIANGVTTVQDLMATPESVAARASVERGEMIGPRIILAKMIDGPQRAWPPPLSAWVKTPAEARAAVLSAREDGYDKIKVYSFLSKDSYDAITEAAREAGIEVMGHVPMDLSVEYVIEAGQNAIAHSEEIAKHTSAYDAERVDYYAQLLVDSEIWMIPTLVTTHNFLQLFEDPDRLFATPGAEYFSHPMQRAVWMFLWSNLYEPIPPEDRAKLRDAYVDFQRPLIKAMHDKGGGDRLLAGSDALMAGLVAGFSLHGELQELVDVGLTPFEALQTATVNPAAYLGESALRGTIELGKETDLLLIDANPIEDVAAASKIAGVLMRGRWISAKEIRRRMEKIAAGDHVSAK